MIHTTPTTSKYVTIRRARQMVTDDAGKRRGSSVAIFREYVTWALIIGHEEQYYYKY